MHLLQQEILIFMGVTIVFAFFDLRTHHVPVSLFVIGTVLGILFCVFNKRGMISILTALVPGILLVLLALCTEGGIGLGDGHYLMVSALFLDWKEVTALTALSMFLAAAVSLVLIVYGRIAGKSMRKKSLPFLAFMPFALGAVYALCGR